MSKIGHRLFVIALVVMGAICFFVFTDVSQGNAQPVCHPNLFCVNDTADAPDVSPGDNKCATASNRCTLRAAIEEANALKQPRQIRLDAALYQLNKMIVVQESAVITITGASPVGPASSTSLRSTIIEPAPSALPSRVLHVHPEATVTLANLTIRHGDLSNLTNGLKRGSAIYNQGVLRLQDCLVTKNLNDAGGSGSIYNSGNLTLIRTSVRGNGSDQSNGVSKLQPAHGGGIYHAGGTLDIQESELINNRASSGGGGVHADAPMTITRSTIAGNQAAHGGGVSTTAGGPSIAMRIENSTLSHNAAQSGSAIDNNGSVSLVVSSTITNNFFIGSSPDLKSTIFVNSGSLTLQNTILHDPKMKSACRYDTSKGKIVSAGYNIIQPHINPSPPAVSTDTYECTLTATDQDVDPKLEPAPKVHAPGATATYALESTSPARNRIPRKTPNGSPLVDQRGVARPQPETIANSAFDIGAYEYNRADLIMR